MKFFPKQVRPLLIGGVVGCLCAVAFSFGLLRSWSERVTDRFFLPQDPSEQIVIVAIDDESIQAIGRWPWDRSVHADLIRRLAEGGALVIGYDVNFSEGQNVTHDTALTRAIGEAGNVVLPTELALSLSLDNLVIDPSKTIRPLPALERVVAGVGHSNLLPDTDGVVRRLPVSLSVDSYVFMSFVGMVLQQSAVPYVYPPVDTHGFTRITFSGGMSPFDTISAVDILEGSVSSSVWEGKIVLVGATAPDLHDEQAVPSSAGPIMAGVEIHASALRTLMDQRWLVSVPFWWQFIQLILIGVLIGVLFAWLRSRFAVLLVVIAWIGFLLLSALAFESGMIFDLVWPTLVFIGGSILVVLERRMTAERDRKDMRRTLSRYLAPPVVEAALRDPNALTLRPERRTMTVLFSDVRGFTSLSEQLDPEELVKTLSEYLGRMTEVIFQHGGTLDKYMGDAVMAFWNAPFDQEDHALCAVRAAIAMRDTLKQMNDDGVFHGNILQAGIGLNTGVMVVGDLGGSAHADYTVIGDNVNLGSRLEGLTKQYGVSFLISQATVHALHGKIVTRQIDRVAVKGRTEPTDIYEVLGENVSDAVRQSVFPFEEALRSYFSAHFEEAEKRFMSYLETYPNDAPALLLLARTRQFIQHPPAEDWDGTWVLKTK